MAVALAFEEVELIMVERIESTKEAAPAFQQTLAPETSTAGEGKGKEIVVPTKKTE